jgi:hypothetical protein
MVKMEIKTFNDFRNQYTDEVLWQKELSDILISKLKENEILYSYRLWVESHIWGFGEKEFITMWDLLIKHLFKTNGSIKCLEVGIFKGQILCLWGLLAKLYDFKIERYGITPLSSAEIGWESDYENDIKTIHNQFDVPIDYIIYKGFSSDNKVIVKAANTSPYDVFYCDGSHQYENVLKDLDNYLPMVKVGGYLIMDDSSNNLKCCYDGRFWGIKEVSDAVDSLLPPMAENDNWKYIGCIIHNRIWEKIK